MLLEKLREYEDRVSTGDVAPRLYRSKPIRYLVDLDSAGRPVTGELIDQADPSSPRTRRGTRRLAPEVQRASGIRPLLLADKADYVLGYVEPDAPQAKVRRAKTAHSAFVEQAKRCSEATNEPAVRSAAQFLERRPLAELTLPEGFDPGATITFIVDGVLPIDLPAVQEFWAAENTDEDRRVMQCVVCGQTKPVLERLQEKIKGVPGGQTSGTALISANEEAFESYGMPASLVAPTCTDCAERFTRALNGLIGGEETSLRIGNTVAFVFWTREEVEYSFQALLAAPQPQDVRALIDSARSGIRSHTDPAPFYCMTVSGNGGRTVVRDWFDATVGEVKEHLARWFELQDIVDPHGGAGSPLGLWRMARATVRDPADISPNVPRALLRAAFAGSPIPQSVLFEAVKRNKAERRVTRDRAALIKLVTLSNARAQKEGSMVKLDTDNEDPAYLCGRLLAVLEQVQRAALPGVRATIVDRFFGTASSAPASVFGRLIRGAQPHLSKLERDKRGAYIVLQRSLEDVLSNLQRFPWTLSLDEQGRFALGYYHQRAAGWGKRNVEDDDGQIEGKGSEEGERQ